VTKIRVEPEGPIRESACASCGGTNRLLHGFVYGDESPHGIYFVEWCDGEHARRAAYLTLGLGVFGEGSDGGDRAAVCIEWRSDGMRLTEEPARDRPDLLGAFVPRRVALELPGLDDMWHVADHIVLDDPRLGPIQEWLEGAS
jgi:hypothetical protein